MFPVQKELKTTLCIGMAMAVGNYDDDAQPEDVCGMYEISTIEVCGRMETVAFRRSGIGPDQIAEPYHVKTLEVKS